MFYTYILFSEKFDKYYIGFTHDLNGRLVATIIQKTKATQKDINPGLSFFPNLSIQKKKQWILRSI